jgi:hypothetical protein
MERLDSLILKYGTEIVVVARTVAILLVTISSIISAVIIDQKRKKSFIKFKNERDSQQRNFGRFH